MRKLRYFLYGRLFPCALLLALFAAAAAILSIYLPRALAPLALAERLFSLGTGIAVVNSSAPSESKTAKLILLLLLPWTGAVVCMPRPFKVPARIPRARSECFRDERFGALGRVCAESGLNACRAKSAEYFATGGEMLPRYLSDLAGAKKSVYLEYYIVGRGEFWNGVLAILEQKAKEGVDVRLVYDDWGCSLTLPRTYAEELEKRGIKTAVFHRVRPFPFYKLNHRDHRKCAVIDGNIAYTGGINLSDEYIGRKIRFGHWKDSAVRICGEPAREFCVMFAHVWNGLRPADRINTADMPPFSDENGADMPACIPFCGVPSQDGGVCGRALRKFISSAERTLFIVTPYLAPDEALFSALCTAATAGTDVRIMIPHIPDKKTVFLLTRANARKLEKAGVKVREYTEGFLHAKSAVSDGEYSAVSSCNLDFRSLYLQYECGAFFRDRALAEEIERDFLAAWETGTPVKSAARTEKFLCFFLRLFSPLA